MRYSLTVEAIIVLYRVIRDGFLREQLVRKPICYFIHSWKYWTTKEISYFKFQRTCSKCQHEWTIH